MRGTAGSGTLSASKQAVRGLEGKGAPVSVPKTCCKAKPSRTNSCSLLISIFFSFLKFSGDFKIRSKEKIKTICFHGKRVFPLAWFLAS